MFVEHVVISCINTWVCRRSYNQKSTVTKNSFVWTVRQYFLSFLGSKKIVCWPKSRSKYFKGGRKGGPRGFPREIFKILKHLLWSLSQFCLEWIPNTSVHPSSFLSSFLSFSLPSSIFSGEQEGRVTPPPPKSAYGSSSAYRQRRHLIGHASFLKLLGVLQMMRVERSAPS